MADLLELMQQGKIKVKGGAKVRVGGREFTAPQAEKALRSLALQEDYKARAKAKKERKAARLRAQGLPVVEEKTMAEIVAEKKAEGEQV